MSDRECQRDFSMSFTHSKVIVLRYKKKTVGPIRWTIDQCIQFTLARDNSRPLKLAFTPPIDKLWEFK